MTIRLPLFDDMKRTDACPRQHNEPWFAYLNRSAIAMQPRSASGLNRGSSDFRSRLDVMLGKGFAGMTIMLIWEQFSNYSYMNCLPA